MDVFEATPPLAVYVPAGADWSATATTACTLAVCTAPARPRPRGRGDRPRRHRAGDPRQGHQHPPRRPHRQEDRDVADSLLVIEVFTPRGNWSSYPPHKHDEDDFPRMTYLEETYYHRLNPAAGFGLQRVYTEDGSLDETMAVADRDVVLVPKGHHPCAAPYGYDLYYLNVMAGPPPQVALPEPPGLRLDLPARRRRPGMSRPLTFAAAAHNWRMRCACLVHEVCIEQNAVNP